MTRRLASLSVPEDFRTLQHLMNREKHSKRKERLHMLYLIKGHFVESQNHLSKLLSRNRQTINRWLTLYETGQLAGLLMIHTSPGRPPTLPPVAQEALKKNSHHPSALARIG